MKIKILVSGKIKETRYASKSKEYLKWISSQVSLDLVFLKDNDLKKLSDKQIHSLDPTYFSISLSEEGKGFSSKEFSNFIYSINKDLIFIIGPPDGLSEKLKESTDFILSISKFTLPHELAYLVLIEQIYRAMSIQNGSKYHRA